VYSFGSLLWPALRPDLLRQLISALIEADIPFMFVAKASPFANLSQDLQALVASHGNKGMILDFAPQKVVLAHESVGFFVVSYTHSPSFGDMLIWTEPYGQ